MEHWRKVLNQDRQESIDPSGAVDDSKLSKTMKRGSRTCLCSPSRKWTHISEEEKLEVRDP